MLTFAFGLVTGLIIAAVVVDWRDRWLDARRQPEVAPWAELRIVDLARQGGQDPAPIDPPCRGRGLADWAAVVEHKLGNGG